MVCVTRRWVDQTGLCLPGDFGKCKVFVVLNSGLGHDNELAVSHNAAELRESEGVVGGSAELANHGSPPGLCIYSYAH